jgi:hypothetical protein
MSTRQMLALHILALGKYVIECKIVIVDLSLGILSMTNTFAVGLSTMELLLIQEGRWMSVRYQ